MPADIAHLETLVENELHEGHSAPAAVALAMQYDHRITDVIQDEANQDQRRAATFLHLSTMWPIYPGMPKLEGDRSAGSEHTDKSQADCTDEWKLGLSDSIDLFERLMPRYATK